MDDYQAKGGETRTANAEQRWQDPDYRATILDGSRRFWDGHSPAAEKRRRERSERAKASLQDPVRQAIRKGRDTPEGRVALAGILQQARAELDALPLTEEAPGLVRIDHLPNDLKVALRPEVRTALRNIALVNHGSTSREYDRLAGKSRGDGALGHDKPVRLDWLIDYCRRNQLNPRRLEHSIVGVFRHEPGKGFHGPLPVRLGPDHAWLLGLAAAGAEFPKGNECYLRADAPVIDLAETALARLGASAYRREVDRGRTGPKAVLRLTSAFTAVLQCAGLPRGIKVGHVHHHAGTRRQHLSIPSWIRGDRQLLHKFTEGFLNGGSNQYTVGRTDPRRDGVFKMSVQGTDAAVTAEFAHTLQAILEQRGITGTPRIQTAPFGHVHSYYVTARACLEGLFTEFQLRRHNALRLRAALGLPVDDDVLHVARRPDDAIMDARPRQRHQAVQVSMVNRMAAARQALDAIAAPAAPAAAVHVWAFPRLIRVQLRDDVRGHLYTLTMAGGRRLDLLRKSLQDPKRTGRKATDRRGALRLHELQELAKALHLSTEVLESCVTALYHKLPAQAVATRFPIPLTPGLAWLVGVMAANARIAGSRQPYCIIPTTLASHVEAACQDIGVTVLHLDHHKPGRGKKCLTFPTPFADLLNILVPGWATRTGTKPHLPTDALQDAFWRGATNQLPKETTT
jgi:hypothetical protein